MRLSRLFMCTTGLLLTLVALMLARATILDWRIVQAAERGQKAMQLAYLAMKVAEKSSAERGPTIPVLNDGLPVDAKKRERLTLARASSDEALALALDGLNGERAAPFQAAASHLAKAQQQLKEARAEVDRVASLPPKERFEPATRLTRRPIDQLFAVIDTVLESVTLLSAEAEKIHPDLSLPLVGARYAAELREYTGRLGSQFTAPLATQKPLGADEQREIPLLVGRIQQLRKLVEVRAKVAALDPRLDQAIAEMNRRYFAVGLPFIESLKEAGLAGRPYGVESAEFVARYVPEMKSIVQLRDAMFEVAKEGASKTIAQARKNMQTNIALGISILLIEILVFLTILRRVLRPLLKSTANVQTIMEGRLDLNLKPVKRSDEIGEMQNAVAALLEASRRNVQLEQEREHLIEQLQVTSEMDFLTNLLNRRALMQRTEHLLVQARRQQWDLAVILFDIDLFKAVNDQYGHAVGDAALRKVSALAKSESREADLLARYGGEEFILLAANCSSTEALEIAERIRALIANTVFEADIGKTLRITASFGVSGKASADVNNLETLIQSADQALYSAKAQGRNRVVFAKSANSSKPADLVPSLVSARHAVA